jgi:hypothetical protein
MLEKMEYGRTAFNRSVCAPTAGYTKHQSAQAPLWHFVPPHFCPPQTYGLLYKAGKNVAYSQNVIRNAA